jgi:ammonia channel protein AmtB
MVDDLASFGSPVLLISGGGRLGFDLLAAARAVNLVSVVALAVYVAVFVWRRQQIGQSLVVVAVPLLDRLRIDDVVGAIPAHLVAGIWGTLAVGIFGGGDLVAQIIGIAAVGAFVSAASAALWLGLKVSLGIRVSAEHEDLGLDMAELGMEAYPEFGHGSQRI